MITKSEDAVRPPWRRTLRPSALRAASYGTGVALPSDRRVSSICAGRGHQSGSERIA